MQSVDWVKFEFTFFLQFLFMRFSTVISAPLCAILLLTSVTLAFETDQYNLPPVPLTDVGDEVSDYVIVVLRETVADLNVEIDKSRNCIELRKNGCGDVAKEKTKLAKLKNADTLAKRFFDRISGGNLMTTKFGKWMNSHEFASLPARYKAPYKESIYLLNPFNYATLSPTVRLYGHEFGIDKLEHLFQQGYQYFKIYNEAINKGSTAEKANQKAIEWGQKTERTYYGLLTSGVYSNADLFANYVGLKFYMGMTNPLVIGEINRPALVHLANGRWQITEENLRENLLKPFIADQMNEALNPSSYRATLIRSVRRSVVKYACPEWRNVLPSIKPFDLEQRAVSLENWNGEDYGYTRRDRTVDVRATCFDLTHKTS